MAGAGAAVYAMVRARRAAEALTADGLARPAQGLALGARLFRDEVAQGRAEKETELRERLGLVPEWNSRAGGRRKHRGRRPPDDQPTQEGSS